MMPVRAAHLNHDIPGARVGSLISSSSVVLVALLLATCSSTTQDDSLNAPSVEQVVPGARTCKVARDPLNPWIVEWPAVNRTSLESASHRGLVVVSYEGCVLKVLRNCALSGQYEMQQTSISTDVRRIYNTDQLWAELPLGAPTLKAELGQERGLELRYAAVGELVLLRQKKLAILEICDLIGLAGGEHNERRHGTEQRI